VKSVPPPIAFDQAVPDSGYRWWYVDGVSADGRFGLVIIAFVGSVFSPYYYRARQRGPVRPEDYTSINVCLYRPGGDRWAMTERSARSLERRTDFFRVAGSHLAWHGDRLVIEVAERSAPFARRLAGTIELTPRTLNDEAFALDLDDRHFWRPVAPMADIRVNFTQPEIRWAGHGYLDTNYGSRMLELDFATWDWSRSAEADSSSIYYVARLLSGEERTLGLRFDSDGSKETLPVPSAQSLPKTGWRVARQPSNPVTLRVRRVLEDTPFYSRSLLSGVDGESGLIVHESLDMRRFSAAWVRSLLPFRMPRIA